MGFPFAPGKPEQREREVNMQHARSADVTYVTRVDMIYVRKWALL